MRRTEFLMSGEIPVIILDEFYDEEELELIWEELNLLTYGSKLQNAKGTGTAETETGKSLKSNHGLWLDIIWKNNRNLSNILQIDRKIFTNNLQIFRDSSHWFFNLFNCNADTTLLSYYENEDHYKPHYDEATVTVLNWFYREPKRFKGGDLKLHHKGNINTVPFKNNRVVIFPSLLTHEVTPITMEKEDQNKKFGRYCITQFLFWDPS